MTRLLKNPFLLPLFLLFLLLAYQSSAQVVLSEVMFNSAGSEYYDEYIEIYNLFPTQAVQLDDFMIGDQNELDLIIEAGEGLTLQPGQYGIILDPGYWENSTTYDDLIPEDALVMTISDNAFGSGGLRNDPPDTVILCDPTGALLASYCPANGNQDGYSDEKIRLDGGDDEQNWSDSQVYLGTPGFANSVLPCEADLALVSLAVVPDPLPYGDLLTAEIEVLNSGLEAIEQAIIRIGMRVDDTPPLLVLDEISVEEIIPAACIALQFELEDIPSGPQVLSAWHSLNDADPTNDTLQVELVAGYPEQVLLINEFLAAPAAGRSEWIELYNPGEDPVDLCHFRLADEDEGDKALITGQSIVVPPENYVLLAKDTIIHEENLPEDLLVFILNSAWPILNNEGDIISLYDGAEGLLDQVDFRTWPIPDNVSLERIYLDRPSSDPANWQPSLDAAGGTPGRENCPGSRNEPNSSSVSVRIDPDPFDPDRHEELRIVLGLTAEVASATVSVYDLRGRKLQVIFEGGFPPDPLTWDGRDSDHRRIIPGVYILLAQFQDASGSDYQVVKKSFVIAGNL